MVALVHSCPRCPDVELEAVPDPSGAWLESCPRCHGVFLEARDVERALGRLPATSTIELPNPFATASASLVCPLCRSPSLAPTSLAELEGGAHACERCGARFFELRAFHLLRRAGSAEEIPRISTEGLELEIAAMRPLLARRAHDHAPLPTSAAAPSPAAIRPAPELTPSERAALFDETPSGVSRFAHDEPWSRLLTLPIAMLVALLFALTDFGRLLALPLRMQFHELGHAIPAWLSGRLALPLPCGLTFWSESGSALAHVLVLAGSLTLAFHGLRERRPFVVGVAVTIELAHLLLGVLLPAKRSLGLIVLDGCAAELWLPGLAMVSFYFRVPDRLRWDFFRFLVVPAGAIVYVGAMRLWLAVLVGDEAAPLGSILGTVGDGTGDLERLVREHGYTLRGLVRGYVALGIAVGTCVIATYAVFAVRAIRRLTPAS